MRNDSEGDSRYFGIGQCLAQLASKKELPERWSGISGYNHLHEANLLPETATGAIITLEGESKKSSRRRRLIR